MDTIKFSKISNGKLKCRCFTSLRLALPYYKLNKIYRIELMGKYIGNAKLINLRITQLDKVNDFMSYLDADMDSPSYKAMVQSMYKNKISDFVNTQFYYLLFRWEENPQLNFQE